MREPEAALHDRADPAFGEVARHAFDHLAKRRDELDGAAHVTAPAATRCAALWIAEAYAFGTPAPVSTMIGRFVL